MLPVVILAGGLATRMKPITEKIPKSLIEVNGKPFIRHQLDYLKSQGIQNIVLEFAQCLDVCISTLEDYSLIKKPNRT
jgi:NDP-sugar pyrophosphorylase family protein